MATKQIKKPKQHLQNPERVGKTMCGLAITTKTVVDDKPAKTTCKTCRTKYEKDPAGYRKAKRALVSA